MIIDAVEVSSRKWTVLGKLKKYSKKIIAKTFYSHNNFLHLRVFLYFKDGSIKLKIPKFFTRHNKKIILGIFDQEIQYISIFNCP